MKEWNRHYWLLSLSCVLPCSEYCLNSKPGASFTTGDNNVTDYYWYYTCLISCTQFQTNLVAKATKPVRESLNATCLQNQLVGLIKISELHSHKECWQRGHRILYQAKTENKFYKELICTKLNYNINDDVVLLVTFLQAVTIIFTKPFKLDRQQTIMVASRLLINLKKKRLQSQFKKGLFSSTGHSISCLQQ